MPSPPSRTGASDQLDSDPLRMTRACPQTCVPLADLDEPGRGLGSGTKVASVEGVDGGGAAEAEGVALLRSRVGPREGHPAGGRPALGWWAPARSSSGVVVGLAGHGLGRRGRRGRRRRGRRPPTGRSPARSATTTVTPVSSIVGLISWRSASSSACRGSGRGGLAGARRAPRRATGRPGSCPPRRRRRGRLRSPRRARGEVTLVCPAAGIDVEPLSGGYAGWPGRGCGSAWALRTACGLRTRVRSSSSPAGVGRLVGEGGLALLVEHDDGGPREALLLLDLLQGAGEGERGGRAVVRGPWPSTARAAARARPARRPGRCSGPGWTGCGASGRRPSCRRRRPRTASGPTSSCQSVAARL